MVFSGTEYEFELRTVPNRSKRRLFLNGSELPNLGDTSHQNLWVVTLALRESLQQRLRCDVAVEMRTIQHIKNRCIAATKLIPIEEARSIASKCMTALSSLKPEWVTRIAGEVTLRFDVFPKMTFSLDGTPVKPCIARTQIQFFRWVGELLGISPSTPTPVASSMRMSLNERLVDCESRYERLVDPRIASTKSTSMGLSTLHAELRRLCNDATTYGDVKTRHRAQNLWNALLGYAAYSRIHLPAVSSPRDLLEPDACATEVMSYVCQLSFEFESTAINAYSAIGLLRVSALHANSARFRHYRVDKHGEDSRELALLAFLLRDNLREGAFIAAAGAFGITSSDTWQLQLCLNMLEAAESHYHITRTHQAYEVLCIVEELIDRMQWSIDADIRAELHRECDALARDVGAPLSHGRKRASARTVSNIIASVTARAVPGLSTKYHHLASSSHRSNYKH